MPLRFVVMVVPELPRTSEGSSRERPGDSGLVWHRAMIDAFVVVIRRRRVAADELESLGCGEWPTPTRGEPVGLGISRRPDFACGVST